MSIQAGDRSSSLVARPPRELEPAIRKVAEGILARMRVVARPLGWAVAAHGSMIRDLDVVGVPWTEEAAPESTFVEAMRAATAAALMGHCYVTEFGGERLPTLKPHGRHAYTLHGHSDILLRSPAGAHPFVDLSVVDARAALLGEEANR